MRHEKQGQNGTKSSATGYSEDVRVGQWIAKQRLKAGASNGERCTDDNREKNAREANFDDDHAVVAGEGVGLVEQNADQITPETVQGNGNSAKLEGDYDYDEQNRGQQAALKEEASQCQRAHS